MDKLTITDDGHTLTLQAENDAAITENYDGSPTGYGQALRVLVELHIELIESDNV
jgi:hypothetical protein